MKKYLVFVLIFFLAFSLQLKLAQAGATKCRFYLNGICQTWYYFDSSEYEEFLEETVEAPEETLVDIARPTTEFQTKFLTLAFQFFGMIVLFILLMVMVEELVKSGG